MKNINLAIHIHNFLQDYLTLQKGFSHHTILSYRDSIKLFLLFIKAKKKKSIADITISDLDSNMVISFLEDIEKNRGNSPQTRNVRLACIHSFFCYPISHDPWIIDKCQRILAIPFKRTASPIVNYLEVNEMKAILQAIDCKKPEGHRDYTLFTFMYNTGARVQEVISLTLKGLQLERPFQVRFFGKGEKERIVPLWPETVVLLRSLLKKERIKKDDMIFVNHNGHGLSRYGVRYLLKKYVKIASKTCPSLIAKKIHPHTLRHTTASHLLQSGIDINTIRAWLGHVSLTTTNRYAEINLDMKRKVLNNYLPFNNIKISRPWKKSRDIIQWLEAL